MLWWFLILGISTAVVVIVAVSIFIGVKKQMKGAKPESHDPDRPSSPPEL